jgi:hypothetical protein
MNGCYGGGNKVTALEPDMGFGGASIEEEGDMVQMGV